MATASHDKDRAIPSSQRPPRPGRFFNLIVRKERWGLSRRGWCLFPAILLATLVGLLTGVYPFLAPVDRLESRMLVMEGWVREYVATQTLNEFRSGSYDRISSTGGPVRGLGRYVNDPQTVASVGAGMLLKMGAPPDCVQMVPSRVVARDRTYSSAVALREWFRDHHVAATSLNVVTEDVHARRTRLLFQLAFGPEVSVGVIAVPSPDYDARYWWRYSEGVRDVLSEAIAYIYAKCFFFPDDTPHRR